MTTPTWQAATPGSPSYAGQINQFLSAHTSRFVSGGAVIPGATDPSSVVTAVTSNRISTFTYLAQPFTVSSSTSLQYVAPALVAENAGCDLLLTIQPAGTTPTGYDTSTALAYCVIPAEWIPTSTPTTLATTVPLALNVSPTLAANANPYWLVITPYSNCAPNVNDVLWARSGGGMSGLPYAYTVSSSSWATSGTGPFAVYFRTGNTGSLVATTDDNDALKKSYIFTSGRISSLYEWATQQSNANMLCRDDAIFVSSVGTWASSANASVSLASATLSVTATATTPIVRCGFTSSVNIYPVTSNAQYTFTAQVKAATIGRAVTPQIIWYASASSTTPISGSTGTAITDTTTGFTTISVTATAPATATDARVNLTFTGALTSEVHYVDNVMLRAGIGTTFVSPGAGISSTRSITYTSDNKPIAAV